MIDQQPGLNPTSRTTGAIGQGDRDSAARTMLRNLFPGRFGRHKALQGLGCRIGISPGSDSPDNFTDDTGKDPAISKTREK